MTEWIVGCITLIFANIAWEIILIAGASSLGVGLLGLTARAAWMIFTFGLWTLARRKWL